MQQRTLGKTGLRISEVGLGCWQFGGDFGPVTETAVADIINTAMTSAIDFFDTADVYGAGRSERLLGAHLQHHREIRIATKYGRGPDTWPDKYSLVNLRDAIRRAQDRLQRDRIDLLQLHCVPRDLLVRGEVFDWLRTVQQEQHIDHFGASVETVEEALICTEQDDLATLQVIFNIFRQKMIQELFPVAQQKNIGIIVRLPLASGLLSGKFQKDTQFSERDHRRYNRNGEAFNVGETFAGLPFEKGVDLTEELRQWLPQGLSMAQMAMRWILDHDAVSTVIAGASSTDQVKMNASASELEPLGEDFHQQLAQFYQNRVKAHIRGPY